MTQNVRNIGVQFGAEVTMESLVIAVCRSATVHLRNVSRIGRYLTAKATEQVILAFFTRILDDANALLYRLPFMQIQRLQKVQKLAARLIEGAMNYSYAIQLLIKFHWLPIGVRVEFNILLLTH